MSATYTPAHIPTNIESDRFTAGNLLIQRSSKKIEWAPQFGLPRGWLLGPVLMKLVNLQLRKPCLQPECRVPALASRAAV